MFALMRSGRRAAVAARAGAILAVLILSAAPLAPAQSDTTAPSFSSAAVDGKVLTVTFDEALDSGSAPAGSTFSVSAAVSGTTRTIAGTGTATISGKAVSVTLASAVERTETATVGYTKPGSGSTLRDAATNEVATFSGQTVTNNSVPPTVTGLVVIGDDLTLTLSEDITDSTDAFATASAWVLRSGPASVDRDDRERIGLRYYVDPQTRSRAPNYYDFGRQFIHLLEKDVSRGHVVTLSYTRPASGGVQDTNGNEMESFANQNVTNQTPADQPLFVSAAVNGTSLVMTFSHALKGNSNPGASAFTVTVGTATRTVNGVVVSGKTVTLTLASAVTHTDTVKVRYSKPGVSSQLQGSAGSVDVPSFGYEDVTNDTPDRTPPVFQEAAVDGTQLTLTFDENLDTSSQPAPSTFFVTVGDARRDVAAGGVAIAGTVVTLTLASAVTHTDTVKVRYTKPSSNPLRDVPRNDVATFPDQAVTNNTPDTTPPVFQEAEVNGTQLTLTFDENLDTSSQPAPSTFFVTVGDARRDVAAGGVAIAGTVVTLTLASAVTHTDTVKVRYTKPSSNPLRDVPRNDVATFPDQDVTNNTDQTAPRLVSASVNGAKLEMRFSENLRILVIHPFAFRVKVNGRDHAIDSTWKQENNEFGLLLSEPVVSGDVVTVRYIKLHPSVFRAPHNPLQDAAGNEVESFSHQLVENLTPPALRSAVVSGTTLTLTFDEGLDPDALPPAASAFAVAGTETPTVVEAVAFHPTDTTRVLLTLSQAVARGQSVTVSYVEPALNPLRDAAGNKVADFTDEPVTHPAPPPPPPPPPPGTSTVPSFDDGDTVQLHLAREHAGGAPVGTVAATDADGDALIYSLAGDDSALFTIDATGLIAVRAGIALAGEGKEVFTLTAQVSDGEDASGFPESTPAIDDTITVTVTLTDVKVYRVPLAPAASHPWAQGFVRVVNHSGEGGTVSILATDDAGVAYAPVVLDIEAHQTLHFNSYDLESGNARKGIASGTGPPGPGSWRLALESALDLEVLSYIRTDDGFVTSMHDVAPEDEAGGYRVVFFNPGSNRNQVSRLRLTNPGEAAVEVSIAGTDDAGNGGASVVVLTLPAGASRSVTAQALELGGEGLLGRLGDGKGKWRLRVSAKPPEPPIRVMSLLQSPTGHLTNLSATPREKSTGAAAGAHRVPLAPSASDPYRRQGFVRVVNHSGEDGAVSVLAIDDAGVRYDPVVLDIDAHETVHFNSDDLEAGNPRKGLARRVGPGEGSWRLVLESALDLEVLAYIRTADGFVTSMHDVAPVDEAGHRVVFVNPARNRNQVSWLRLINPGEEAVAVHIEGTDDAGKAGQSPVELTLPAGASRLLSAQALESGQGEGLSGRLGDGKGKWRLRVSAKPPEPPIRVMSLLESPTGHRHLTNLSAVPGRP